MHRTYIRYIGHIVHMEYIVTPHWVYMYPIILIKYIVYIILWVI